jgi:hypothetical protein
LSDGADHDTAIAPDPSGDAVTFDGPAGTYAALGAPRPAAAGDEPTLFVATNDRR